MLLIFIQKNNFYYNLKTGAVKKNRRENKQKGNVLKSGFEGDIN